MINPTKLKHDAIIEVVFEIRFTSDELPEIVVGRLADNHSWANFLVEKLPCGELPASLRQNDPSLRYEAVLQLRSPNNDRLVRIGANSISYHLIGKYCGWTSFCSELKVLTDWLFALLKNINVDRLGLRYIDALRSDLHKVDGINLLNLKVNLGKKQIEKEIMLNFSYLLSSDHKITARITSGDMALGQLPEKTEVITDLDVYTPDGKNYSSTAQLISWLEDAHTFNKAAFFELLPEPLLKDLAVE